jgi:membrane associated rhomboid family serine protease
LPAARIYRMLSPHAPPAASEGPRMSSYAFDDEHDPPRITPAVLWLIAANVAIYFVHVTLPFRALDVQRALGFAIGDLSSAPWKALTYMFAHGGLMHLAGNMLMLWVLGTRLEHAWRREARSPAAGSQGFTTFYLWCGLGGWLAHVLFVKGGLLIGASAAVYGVMLAYARRWPDTELLLFFAIPVKIKYLVIGYAAYDLLQGVAALGGNGGGVAYLAHVGGFAFAYLWFLPSREGLDRLRERMTPAADVPDETPRAIPRPLPRAPRERGSEIEEIIARSKAAVAKREPAKPRDPVRPPLALVTPSRKEALDHVLDKISEQGLDSLTSDERRLLEEMSRKLRSEQAT